MLGWRYRGARLVLAIAIVPWQVVSSRVCFYAHEMSTLDVSFSTEIPWMFLEKALKQRGGVLEELHPGPDVLSAQFSVFPHIYSTSISIPAVIYSPWQAVSLL